jgi:hypothetical protein
MEAAAQADREKPVALLHDDFEIICVTTDLTIDGAGGLIYPARRVGSKGAPDLIAIVGDRSSCFHLDFADPVENIKLKSSLNLHRWGILNWPAGGQRVALVYEKPPGPSLAEFMAKGHKFSDAEIKKTVIPALLEVLNAFSYKNITHGAIRPGNIFYRGDGSVVLGECLSTAPSQNQPVSFLTIERGMAMPAGRGVGTIADDVYALGVTVLCLLTGENSLAHVSDEDIISRKMELGSFSAFGARNQLSSSMATFLRGLLNDNATERWTTEHIGHWIAGRVPASTFKASGKRPTRPFEIDKVAYSNPQTLARALFRKPAEFLRLIQNDELVKWTRRALTDVQLDERVTRAMTLPPLLRKIVGTPEEKIMARILIAFHPAAPLRYQNLSVMPDGLATLLFKAVTRRENTQPIAEILLSDLPSFWYSQQRTLTVSQGDYMKRLEFATRMLERYGIERCLYEAALWAPYLGEGFQGHFVFTPHQYIMALEDITGTGSQPSVPIDRHAAAFLAARDARFGDSSLDRLNVSLNETDRILTMLQTMATLQHRFNLPTLPNLANWFNSLLQEAIDRYHHRDSREKVRYELKSAAQQGDLAQMHEAIENPSWILRDKQGFVQARQEHALIDFEIQALKADMAPHSKMYEEIGREVSTVVSGILSIVLAICFLSIGIF